MRFAGRAAATLSLALALLAPPAAEGAGSFALGLGIFDLTGGVRRQRQVEGNLELRRPLARWGLEAAGGLTVTSDASAALYAGLRRDFPVGEGWWVTPALGVALYERGDGKDLGGSLQFRSALEAWRRISGRSRLGVAFVHLSNAGLDDLNPGSNSLLLLWSRN